MKVPSATSGSVPSATSKLPVNAKPASPATVSRAATAAPPISSLSAPTPPVYNGLAVAVVRSTSPPLTEDNTTWSPTAVAVKPAPATELSAEY